MSLMLCFVFTTVAADGRGLSFLLKGRIWHNCKRYLCNLGTYVYIYLPYQDIS